MNTQKNKFVHLRCYSQYSLSRGALRINELVNYCKKDKIPATAISDFDNLFGSLEFCIECEKSGIQPIIGVNLLLKDEKYKEGYVLLLCKNEVGYQNLVKLVSKSHLENKSIDNPHISIEDLEKSKHGLMCLCGGEFGFLTKNFKENISSCDTLISKFIEIYDENFFLKYKDIRIKKIMTMRISLQINLKY